MSKTISTCICETNLVPNFQQENVFFHSLYREQSEFSSEFIRTARSTSPIQICALFSTQGPDNLAAVLNIELNKEKTLSEIRMAEQVHEADLAIRMQTEVVRINHETEQWVKDKEFERLNNINEAIIRYKKELSDIQMNIIKVVGDMSIELRDKAQNLIIEKTQQYQAIQKQAIDDAEVIFDRIETKYADKPRIYDSMIKSTEKILSSVIDNTTEYMSELKIELQNMSKSIDQITQNGQEFINKQIGSYSTLTGKLESGTPNYAISNE